MGDRDSDDARVRYVGATRRAAVRAADALERASEGVTATAATGRDALEARRTGDVDCVVCEHRLSTGTGLALLERVRARVPAVAFVLVVDPERGSKALAVEAFRRGVTDYVERADGEAGWTRLAERVDAAVETARDRRARRRHEALVENLTDLVFTVDDRGAFTYLGPSVERLLGYDPAEPVGEPVLEYVHPADHEAVRQTGRDVRGGAEIATAEFRVRRADGTWLDLEVRTHDRRDDPRVDGLVVVGRDVTDRKTHERRLRALHETTRRLMNAETCQAVAEVTTDAAREVLGLAVNAVFFHDEAGDRLVPATETPEGTDLFEEYPTFERGEGLMWRVFETGESYVADDVSADPDAYNPETPIRSELIHPLGDHGVFVAGTTAVGDFDERTVSLSNVLAANVERALDGVARRDELRERERALAEQNDRLERFASIVAHDLRSPLTVADGYLDLLATEGEDAEGYATNARDALDRMERIVDDLLWLAREGREIGSRTAVDLGDCARFAWGHVDTGTATLAVDSDGRLEADEDRLVQSLENLFRNAVEHGAAGDETDSEGVTVRVGTTADGFYVEDTGPGVPESMRASVFDAGYSTSEDGTGFGLSIVETIVEAHGWEISVDAGDDGGARFEVIGVESLERDADA